MIRVIKASGELEPFAEEKVINSLQRAGVSRQLAQKIVAQIKPKLYDQIPTQKLYHLVFNELKGYHPWLPSRYQLKKAIYQLGPQGYPFEKFFAGILARLGWQTKTNQLLVGRCTDHEIDVLAQKNQKRILIECKFHSYPGGKTDIKDALCLWARFLDLKDQQNLHQAWLVTNNKFTTKAVNYCLCVGIKPISWRYQGRWSLASLVEKSGLYPITTLTTLTQSEKQRFLNQGVVFCRDLIAHLNDFPPKRQAQIKAEVTHLISGLPKRVLK